MSDKLIRDELLRSHRYVSLSNDTTKLLFIHLMLLSDGLSNAEATSTAISIAMGRQITESAAATLLAELSDHDLIRVYESDGKRYAHIPRSRQRIRYLKGKHPRPPVGVEDKEIIELIDKVGLRSDRGQTQVRPKTPEVLLPLPLLLKSEVQEREAGSVAVATSTRTTKAVKQDKATALPKDWYLPDEWRDWTVRVYRITPQRAVQISIDFRDYWHAKAKDYCKRDWLATWRRWVKRECGDA